LLYMLVFDYPYIYQSLNDLMSFNFARNSSLIDYSTLVKFPTVAPNHSDSTASQSGISQFSVLLN
jgi:hypothetical protein